MKLPTVPMQNRLRDYATNPVNTLTVICGNLLLVIALACFLSQAHFAVRVTTPTLRVFLESHVSVVEAKLRAILEFLNLGHRTDPKWISACIGEITVHPCLTRAMICIAA
jgi:hypothetical protein